MKNLWLPIRARLKRIYAWGCYPSWRSWIAHTVISLAIGGGLSLLPLFSMEWGLTIMMSFYIGKEAGDYMKWRRRGELMKDDPSGVPRFFDGIGDVIGPVALALGAWIG